MSTLVPSESTIPTRTLTPLVRRDLARKLVLITGPRQAGKTTLARSLMEDTNGANAAQYLNWDVPADRDIILRHAWRPSAPLVIFDEIHRMSAWKAFLKGAWDGRTDGQQMLVTGSARMDTFRQGGESLAGRYFSWRLHPFSVRELVQSTGRSPLDALGLLLDRGGFPEPLFAHDADAAARWRAQYVDGLIREDVLDYSRVHEIKSMQLLLHLLRERVGTPIKVSRLAQMLQLAPSTTGRYLEILEALFIVFKVTPWHRDIARALLKEAKYYFYDTGLVIGDEGARLENAVAAMLLNHVQFISDSKGVESRLHTIRDKEGHEVDFVLAQDGALTQLVEVKVADAVPNRYMYATSAIFPHANAVQIVRHLRHEEMRGTVAIRHAHAWLAELAA